MIFRADGWWERAKKYSPRLAASDVIPDQTHWHHAFITVVAGGGIAFVLCTLMQMVAGSYGWELPWTTAGKIAFGCLVANLCYLIREIEARWFNWRYNLWDGFLDIYVPALLWVPVWYGSMVVGYWMVLGYAFAFFVLRPRP